MSGVVRRFGRSAAVVSALVLAVGTAAACSSSGSASGGGGGGSSSGSLKDTLKNIHATTQTAGYIEYGDTAQMVKLNGGTNQGSSSLFGRVLGAGADQLSQYSQILPPFTGFDYSTATSAVTVGTPPNAVGVLYGSFDPAAIGAKLAAWGYAKQDRGNGVTAWVYKDNHQIDITKLDPNTGVGPGMTGWLNVVWVSKTSIAYGSATSDLAAAVPAQLKPVSDDPVVGPLADCLGSPLEAFVLTDQKMIGSAGLPAVALGVTATSASDVRMEICAAAPSAAAAQSFAAGFTKAVSSGQDIMTDQPWANLLSNPQTSVIGGAEHVVRLSATPAGAQGASLVVNLVEQNDFAGLLGLPQTLKNGRTVNPGSAASSPTSS
ncbi:hypothetical protein ABIA31_005751 [Catenulispora sp. MAP5-51]|uniref:hypothetical protein n=1 Tax=Catenulispora sp. MAP5-51 TaxID=3156298 RepID=UPI0035170397